jgi:hypothetical protein
MNVARGRWGAGGLTKIPRHVAELGEHGGDPKMAGVHRQSEAVGRPASRGYAGVKRTDYEQLSGATLLAILALCACSHGDPAGSPFDGTYSGTMVPDRNNFSGCFSAKPRPVHIVVANGDLEYRHFGAATTKTNVTADGTFSGSGFNRPLRQCKI